MLFIIFTAITDRIPESAVLDLYIARMADGDTDALGELYRSTSSSVYAYALSVLKNSEDAEDVLHDCFLAVYSAAGSYTSSGKPMAWIITVAKNLCLKKLRDRERFSDISDEVFDRNIITDKMPDDERLILEECMNCLTDEERQIVVLHAVSGFRHREIAEIMQIPLSTVLSKYSIALAKLRKRL